MNNRTIASLSTGDKIEWKYQQYADKNYHEKHDHESIVTLEGGAVEDDQGTE